MTVPTPRYLVPFHPKKVPHFFTDVLVIGGGLAGSSGGPGGRPGAVGAGDHQGRAEAVEQRPRPGGHRRRALAGGPVRGPRAPTRCVAGGSLCDVEVVEQVVREGPERIGELVAWGTRFDQEGGHLALGREGGHGRDRIAHALGDATGKEMMRAVIQRVSSRPTSRSGRTPSPSTCLTHEGACRGALVWNPQHGKTFVWAKQTILCTGGAGQIYRETTNPDVATGDGMAIAYRAGAELRDMEFMQFHPTVLYIAGSSRNLITEALRGEGAYLVDRNGRRFMADYDARAELAPRDVVSLAIVSQMEKTKHPNVYLDLTHLDPERVRARFPGIVAICAEFNLDITKDRIPVRPGAHYMMGGVTVDHEGRTTVPGLWAAGEVASSGLHGANRLASNSLLEALVYGCTPARGPRGPRPR